jgi:hypothetical protein
MQVSPVAYIRAAKLRGELFEAEDTKDTKGLLASVDTRFFVDHAEPLEALGCARESMEWPLGELLDGHEFVLILEAKRRSRSRSSSSRRNITSEVRTLG